jgi:NDP-sugar pyrophosphorylase family protein
MARTKLKTKKNYPKITESDKKPDLISVVVLCDLPGYRMKSYGPTSLVHINNKCLIDIQIDAIKKSFPNHEIILCVGFDAEKISKHIRSKYRTGNIRLVENQLFNSCNSCEGVRLAINNTLNDKILILDGSLLINKKNLLLIETDKTCALIEKHPSENLEIGINVNNENKAQHFSFGAYKTWSELVYVNGIDVIDSLRKFLNNTESKKKFIFEAMNELLRNKYDIVCVENKFPIHKINNIKTYHNIKDNHEIFNI